MLTALRREERGFALVTALLISMVVLSLGLVSVQLSAHNSQASSRDRKLVQAVNAAEAGIDTYLTALPSTRVGSIPCTVGPVSLPIEPGAQYVVNATYYSAYPPTTASELTCVQVNANPTIAPLGVVIVSTGTAVEVGASRAVSRTLKTEARLSPIYGGLDKAIFSDTGMSLVNNLTVNGNNGNDGNLYTNGDFSCGNSSVDYGTVWAPRGSATLSNSCTVVSDLWVRDDITMNQSARVGHNATASGNTAGSTGAIVMNSGGNRIDNNARSARACTGCVTTGSGRNVFGTVTQNSPSAPPTVTPFPIINYRESKWTEAPNSFTVVTFTTCLAAKNWLEQPAANGRNLTTKYVAKITATDCVLDFSQSTTIQLDADLAVILSGQTPTSGTCPKVGGAAETCAFRTNNRTIFESRSSEPGGSKLWFIVPYTRRPWTETGTTQTPCNAAGGDDYLVNNNTDFVNVRVFLYSPCKITMQNNNLGLGGQIYGGTVDLQNQFSFAYRPVAVPGAGDVTGLNPQTTYLREVANPDVAEEALPP
ncbi:MAG: type II secretion system GspH family protein [Actinobacteria bacterium]|nr:type II secretion system GspH family protein [Actinomycetota bacterium]